MFSKDVGQSGSRKWNPAAAARLGIKVLGLVTAKVSWNFWTPAAYNCLNEGSVVSTEIPCPGTQLWFDCQAYCTHRSESLDKSRAEDAVEDFPSQEGDLQTHHLACKLDALNGVFLFAFCNFGSSLLFHLPSPLPSSLWQAEKTRGTTGSLCAAVRILVLRHVTWINRTYCLPAARVLEHSLLAVREQRSACSWFCKETREGTRGKQWVCGCCGTF